jgi:hypothetical protein
MVDLIYQLYKFMTGQKEVIISTNGGSSSSTTTVYVRDCESKKSPGVFR